MDNYWDDFDHEMTEKVVNLSDIVDSDQLKKQLKEAILKRVNNFPFNIKLYF